jgi:hypothetical protein
VFTTKFNIKQERQFMYDVTMRSIRVTIVVAEEK